MSDASQKNATSIADIVLLLLIAVHWSCLTLFGDLCIGWGMVRQIRTLGYSTVLGRITHSSVVEESDVEDGRSYRFDIRYEFLVDGRPYSGSRYRYGSDANGDRAGHYRILACYPVGAHVKVHHAPSDPSDAVLRIGIEAADLIAAMAKLPFNLAMLGFWTAIYRGMRSRLWPPVAGRVKRSHDRRYLRVWLDDWTPLFSGTISGAIVSGLLAFPLMLITVYGFGLYPPRVVPCAAWELVIAGGGVMCYFIYRKELEDDCELVIDSRQRTVLLPRNFGRKEKVAVPWRTIVSIDVDWVTGPSIGLQAQCRRASLARSICQS